MQETSNNHCLWKEEHRAWGSVLEGSLTFWHVFLHCLTFYHVHILLFKIFLCHIIAISCEKELLQ